MEKFTVAGEREGSAAAITRQRNAESIRVAASFDAYGNLFNNEIGELAVRLPGIGGIVGDEGIVSRVSIRGFDFNLNAVTIDGVRVNVTDFDGITRRVPLDVVSSDVADQIEVTKALRPFNPKSMSFAP